MNLRASALCALLWWCAGCQPTASAPPGGTASTTGAKPAPGPVPVDDIRSHPTGCETLPYDPDDCLVDPRARCVEQFREFQPAVANRALTCLRELPEHRQCDICAVNACTQGALEEVSGPPVPACERAARECSEDIGILCHTYAAGMNARGRQRFVDCLIDQCGLGVRMCLWDAMTTSCR